MTVRIYFHLPLTYLLLPTLALETRRRGTPTFESIDRFAAAHCDVRKPVKDLAKQQLLGDEVEISKDRRKKASGR